LEINSNDTCTVEQIIDLVFVKIDVEEKLKKDWKEKKSLKIKVDKHSDFLKSKDAFKKLC